jgi:hypothetical protein
MTSGWLHRATQRSISASSRSSISSKWRLTTPSLLKGHGLSEGCSCGEAGDLHDFRSPLAFADRPEDLVVATQDRIFDFTVAVLQLLSPQVLRALYYSA